MIFKRFTRFFLTGFFPVVSMTGTAQAQYFDIREGNAAYSKADYDKAKAAYAKVLGEQPSLENRKEAEFNTADAEYRKKEYGEAKKRFDALAENKSLDARLRAEAYYNAGNTLYKQSEAVKGEEKLPLLAESMKRYKQSLALNPADLAAKQNYEFVRAAWRKQKPPDDDSDPPGASEFAKQLKRRAKALAAARRYSEAYQLMESGKKQDATVALYQGFIDKIKDVSKINN